MHQKYIDLSESIPIKIITPKSKKENDLTKEEDCICLSLSYITNHSNNSKREHYLIMPRFIRKDERIFEVLGLLQAEMGKTNNGNLSFSNHEPKIINYVLNWFEKELELNRKIWRWSIKVNIREPLNTIYKKEIAESFNVNEAVVRRAYYRYK